MPAHTVPSRSSSSDVTKAGPTSGYSVSLLPFQLTSPAKVPIQSVPSRRHEQSVRRVGKLLPRRWLPGDSVKSIEAEQTEFGAEPQIPIGRLGHREDRAHGEPVSGCPRRMPVLADVERRIERERSLAAEQSSARQQEYAHVRSEHCAHWP